MILLGMDIGTSSLKVGAVDGAGGEFLGWSEARYELLHPGPGLSELPAERYWQAFGEALTQLSRRIDLKSVRALCVSSQGQTFVPVDRGGNCLQNAWTWIDGRAASEAGELNEHLSREQIVARTGMDGLGAGSFAAMAKHLRDRHEEVYRRTWKLLHVSSYLIHRLTGRAAWDANIASMASVYDWRRSAWWDDMLEAINVDVSRLPEVLPSGTVCGEIAKKTANQLGLPAGTMVVTGCNDQPANAIGAGVIDENRVLVVLGTALIAFKVIPGYELHHDPVRFGGIWSVFPLAGTSFQLGYTTSGCGTFDWAKGVLADEASYERVFEHIGRVPIGSEGVTSLIDLDGRAWPTNSAYRGLIAGLSRRSDRWTILRAVVEGISFTLREMIEQLGWDVTGRSVRVVGGAARSQLWVQMIADVLGARLERLAHEQSGVVGSAVMAGVASGAFGDYQSAVDKVVKVADSFEPDTTRQADYGRLYERFQRLRRSGDDYYGPDRSERPNG